MVDISRGHASCFVSFLSCSMSAKSDLTNQHQTRDAEILPVLFFYKHASRCRAHHQFHKNPDTVNKFYCWNTHFLQNFEKLNLKV